MVPAPLPFLYTFIRSTPWFQVSVFGVPGPWSLVRGPWVTPDLSFKVTESEYRLTASLEWRRSRVGFLVQLWQQDNLGTKSADNSSIAEHQQRQRQQVGDKDREKCDDFLHSIALIDAICQARSLHDIRSQKGEWNLTCWNDDPDECNSSIHETLLRVQLHNAQYHNFYSSRARVKGENNASGVISLVTI